MGTLREDLQDELFIWRPVLAKIVNPESILNGDIDLTTLLKLNALLDLQAASIERR